MARTFVSRVLDESGALAALLKVRRAMRGPWLTVLTYHRVGDPSEASFIDDQVVDVRPDAFERQLAFVKEHCTPISFDDLLAFRRGARLPPNPVLVTFDDGYLDNHTTALPILLRQAVPAVFFIATDYMDERRMFWWDRVNWIIKRSSRETLELTYPRKRSFPLGTSAADRRRALRSTLAIIKAHYALDLPRFIDDLERAAGVSLARDDERKMVDGILMTWDHVRALRRAGMSVQSHTRTHRTLHTLPAEELESELAGSRMRIEDVLDEQVLGVACPVGKGLDRAPLARLALRRVGYELCFSNGSGINSLWRFDPLNVRRVSLEVDLPDAHFRGMVAVPYFAYDTETSVAT